MGYSTAMRAREPATCSLLVAECEVLCEIGQSARHAAVTITGNAPQLELAIELRARHGLANWSPSPWRQLPCSWTPAHPAAIKAPANVCHRLRIFSPKSLGARSRLSRSCAKAWSFGTAFGKDVIAMNSLIRRFGFFQPFQHRHGWVITKSLEYV